MQIYSMQSFNGKNIYSHKPVIKMVLNIGDLHNTETKHIKGFNESILELFPGLNEHYCSLGYKGGFTERLKEGTYIGHVTEHLILELQSMIGHNVIYGKTRLMSEPSLYYVVYEYIDERCGKECAKAAVDIVLSLVRQESVNPAAILEGLRAIAAEDGLGPSTKAIYEEAKKRGIPVSRIGADSFLQLGYGKYSRVMQASLTDTTSCIAADMVGNKHLTKDILINYNIPVPQGDIAYSEKYAVEIAEGIGYPVVIKPLDSSQGKGVTICLMNEAQVRAAYHEAMKYSKAVIVEKFIKGKDYRVLVVGDKVSAVSERRPPSVTGDGIHTIKELVEIENRNGLRGNDHERPLTKIKLDPIANQILMRKGMDENYVPALHEIINLRENGNISTGGTARDCTNEIHPYNSFLAVRTARALGLDIAGIDMTIENISVPMSHKNGAVLEVNAAPGLRMHLYPTEGEQNNVAVDIIDMMYPAGKPFTIPIVSVTGTNGKTTTTRLIRHVLSISGKKVGMSSTSGIYIGDECILKGDNTGPLSAKMILSNKEVEAAVLETARGGLVRKGLGYDLADVGVITNISDDHIGLDGLNNLEDLAFVKSLVIEAIKPDGYAVLNVDDSMIDYLSKRTEGRRILFSKEANNPVLLEHMGAGEKAVFLKENRIYIYDGAKKIPFMNIEEIPITFGGMVECNIENSLAAISALCALDVSLDAIRAGLETFKPDIVTNPGRFNIFDMGNFRVMLDYSHNIAGYQAVIKAVQKMDVTRLVGIIGMPGDRLDKNIMEVGGICARAFSRIYVKEDRDLRGREPGEVAGILLNAVLECGFKKENVSAIHEELNALETAILDAQPGDLIILFYEEFEPAVELVQKMKKELEQTLVQVDELIQEVTN